MSQEFEHCVADVFELHALFGQQFRGGAVWLAARWAVGSLLKLPEMDAACCAR